jgi:uncharacterized heparinase superfamily protein
VNGDNGAIRIPWSLLLIVGSIISGAIVLYERMARVEAQAQFMQDQFSAEHGAILHELEQLQQFEAGEQEHGKNQDRRLDELERKVKP